MRQPTKIQIHLPIRDLYSASTGANVNADPVYQNGANPFTPHSNLIRITPYMTKRLCL
jgi:hypothetical protein